MVRKSVEEYGSTDLNEDESSIHLIIVNQRPLRNLQPVSEPRKDLKNKLKNVVITAAKVCAKIFSENFFGLPTTTQLHSLLRACSRAAPPTPCMHGIDPQLEFYFTLTHYANSV